MLYDFPPSPCFASHVVHNVNGALLVKYLKNSVRKFPPMHVFSISRPSLVRIVLYCGRVPAANAPGCTAAEGLLYKPWSLVVPTCTARYLHQRPQQ